MANPDISRGLVPVRDIYSSPYNGGLNHYSFAAGDSVAAFIGDPVKLVGTSQTINGIVYSDIAQAATGDVIVGVIVAMAPVTADSLLYRAASTLRVAMVCDDPNVMFEIQESAAGTSLTANDAGLNANFVVGTGSTYTGLSAVKLNNVGEATTNTLDLKILRPVNRPDNEIGESCKWLVRINRHQYANQIAGV